MRRALAAGLLAGALWGCAGAMYPVGVREAGSIEARTADGWTLALRHYPARAGAPRRRHPVILCHGIMSNTYTWDLDDRSSFAVWLQRRGFEVYALDLRGGGASERPGLLGDKAWTWSVDDYIRHDVPAALAAVSARHGGRPVHWVGHSMGGIVMYGWLPLGEQAAVRSLTAVGAPAVLPHHLPWLEASGALLPLGEWLLSRVPTGALSTLGAPWAAQPAVAPLHVLWNLDNLPRGAARKLAAHGTADLPIAVLRQFFDSMVAGRLVSRDGARDYTGAMRAIEVPTLFVAGSLDHLGTPASMMGAFRMIRSPIKRLVVIGRANGAAADYGHLDLTIGESAAVDVFPVIHDWLVARD